MAGWKHADFRMATFLPFNDVAKLPLADYPSVNRWYRRLEEIDAWRDPFEGLDAPSLPPLSGQACNVGGRPANSRGE